MATLAMHSNEIVSVSDIARKFKEIRNNTIENGKSVIFNQNKPELVLVTISKYEELLTQIEELNERLEYYEIHSIVESVSSQKFYDEENFMAAIAR